MRIGLDGEAEARASSHHGYNGAAGDWFSDSGLTEKAGWTASNGRYLISGGSHAGRVGRATPPTSRGRFSPPPAGSKRPHRWTEPGDIRILPIEPIATDGRRWRFAVSPPWAKRVYRDPEYQGTD